MYASRKHAESAGKPGERHDRDCCCCQYDTYCLFLMNREPAVASSALELVQRGVGLSKTGEYVASRHSEHVKFTLCTFQTHIARRRPENQRTVCP